MAYARQTDTPQSLLWINGTHAILTITNNGNVNLFGTMANNAGNRSSIRQALEGSWGITNKQGLDEMINSLTAGRHNPGLLEEANKQGITGMSRAEFESKLARITDRRAAMHSRNIFEAYQAFGENAIMGWDLSRATQLSAWGYIAGFYSREEAVNKALAIGRVIQSKFNSWDDFNASYLYGYAYWRRSNTEDPNSSYAQRVRIAQELKNDARSPFNLAWNLDLNN
ncbi:MAG: DUF1266 domain-containing protein [Bacteroidales bacterium]|nr:DUF1266 domain-containing protein [Bacteroidales bacterium]